MVFGCGNRGGLIKRYGKNFTKSQFGCDNTVGKNIKKIQKKI